MKTYRDYPKINNDRINFSKISGTLPLPNLVEIQTESYKNFLNHGIDEVFKDVFPIENASKTMEIQYISSKLGEPEKSFIECKERDLTYEVPLTVTFRLFDMQLNTSIDSDVYMGKIPCMTESGTFIINGAERVIVSQIVRSPGAYFSCTEDKKIDKKFYNADLIPYRGTWLQFESDAKGLLWVRIDRQRKLPATVLIKALGIADHDDIISLFGDRTSLRETLEKDKDINEAGAALVEMFKKLKPGEPITANGVVTFFVQKFFDGKRYDLGNAGRFKYKEKLGIYNRLPGMVLAEDLYDVNGEVRFEKGKRLTQADVDALQDEEFFEKGAHEIDFINSCNDQLVKKIAETNGTDESHCFLTIVKVYSNEKEGEVANIIGTDLNSTCARVTISDMIALFSYFMNLMDGFGQSDDIDNLSNRRIRSVGELVQNEFRSGLTKLTKNAVQKMSISQTGDVKDFNLKSLINIKPLNTDIKSFFSSSQLSQYMDQVNPLAELANKRRISALGPGGLTRDRASLQVRDVHFTHYGRICPIETPEGQNIGLISNLASYAKIDEFGFIRTPYRRIEKGTGKILEEVEYLSAAEEWDKKIAQATKDDIRDGHLVGDKIVTRFKGENIMANVKDIDFMDESPSQVVSVAAACIPFLENDDGKRALMGSNMQRQALPLLRPAAPYVGTGIEHKIAVDCGLAVLAVDDGVVTYSDSRTIRIMEKGGERTYTLQKFEKSNADTCINQVSIVKRGQKVKKGEIIADGPSMDNGDLALGQNVVVAFMTWEGLNYEDAVIMSDRLVKNDTYTTIHIEAYEVCCRDTKNGTERITADVPNIGNDAKSHLDEHGVVRPGTDVKEGDILVGKTTPKGGSEPSPDQRLLDAIFGDKSKDQKDTSLRVKHGEAGTVLSVKIFTRENGDELDTGVNEKVRVYVAQKRKISLGDKMSGRHGNKGVISKIVPEEDMPFLEDGTPIDILLNPQGVPSRMNIGQILEVHLGMACKKLGGLKVATPVFDGITNDEILAMMKEADMPLDGKYTVYDGRTGEKFDERINVGVMYMIKLNHMVDDKIHARATGPYSLITQQPLGGKAQNGGQRFGEMEVWALEAYGAAYTLQEMMTIKSDDRVGRKRTYESIIKGEPLPKASIPEAFKVLIKELMGLGLDVELRDSNNKVIDMDYLARDVQKEEQKAFRSLREHAISSEMSDQDYSDTDLEEEGLNSVKGE